MNQSDLSRFEKIIGNKELFRLICEGLFKDWDGTYDVYLNDKKKFLFDDPRNSGNFQPFCRLVRSKKRGDASCKAEDEKAATSPRKETSLAYHMCHAGLIDVTVPVEVNGNRIATIFCGQVRLDDNKSHLETLNRIQKLEAQVGYDGELEKLLGSVPSISASELDNVIARLQKVVDYLVNLGERSLLFEQGTRIEQQRLEIIQLLQDFNPQLSDLEISWDGFWQVASTLMGRIIKIIGARCGLILTPRKSEAKHVIVAQAGLSDRFVGRKFELLYTDPAYEFPNGDQVGQTWVVELISDDPGPLLQAIKNHNSKLTEGMDKGALVKMALDDAPKAAMVFFLNSQEDTASKGLSIEKETIHLEQLASIISVAFNNRRAIDLQQAWLESVTHQLLAPMNATLGYAENIQRNLYKWENNNQDLFVGWEDNHIKRLTNDIDGLLWTTQYTTDRALNLSKAERTYTSDELEFEIVENPAKLLIRLKRIFEAMAATASIQIHVDDTSFAPLKKRIKIIETDSLFRQAIGNIIDNAVKYSYSNTKIEMSGTIDEQYGYINISNIGIQLPEEEIRNIFKFRYRSSVAQQQATPGSGIGLSLARYYIELHGGTLTAQPSTIGEVIFGRQSWHTVFTIKLPLYD